MKDNTLCAQKIPGYSRTRKESIYNDIFSAFVNCHI